MGAGGDRELKPIRLEEVEFERIGRMYGELMAAENIVLRARLAVAEAERACDIPGQAFNAEMAKLAASHGFDADVPWRLDAKTKSLIPVPGAGRT